MIKKTEQATKFLKKVRSIYQGNYKIHMILDNWSVHGTKSFKETAKLLNIDLHFIPTSAPYYNKIEQSFFGVMQKEFLNGSNFNDIDELKKGLVEYVDEKFNKHAFHDNQYCLY